MILGQLMELNGYAIFSSSVASFERSIKVNTTQKTTKTSENSQDIFKLFKKYSYLGSKVRESAPSYFHYIYNITSNSKICR